MSYILNDIIEKIAKKYVFQENPEKLVERIDKGRFNRESNTIEKLALLQKGDEHDEKVHKEGSQNTTPETVLDDPFGFGDEGEGSGFFDDIENEPDENDRKNGNDIASEADGEKSEEISEDSAENGDEDMEEDDGPDGDADYL